MDIKDMDPQFKKYLKEVKLKQTPVFSISEIEKARMLADERTYSEISKPEKVFDLTDIVIRGYRSDITLRFYKPERKPPLPILLFFHGGGWALGNLKNYESFCTQIVNLSSCAVVSVDYNLAPEHKFPEPVEDCYSALIWILKNGNEYGLDPSRLIICGDSAGGNISAVITLMARDRGISSIGYQVLIYPVVDLSSFDYESFKLFGTGNLLNTEDMPWAIEKYLNSEDERFNPYVSPILAKDFSNLPPAYVITTGYDILRDEGHVYAVELIKAGVPVTIRCYKEFMHGFFTMDAVSDAVRPAIVETAEFLKKVFNKLV
jgi:acetyl esterase